jgi:hypothetical protein
MWVLAIVGGPIVGGVVMLVLWSLLVMAARGNSHES